jgi:ribosomal protein S27E
MQTQTVKINSKAKINYYQISCEACHLNQFYHGKRHTRCIHCGTALDLRKVKPKY